MASIPDVWDMSHALDCSLLSFKSSDLTLHHRLSEVVFGGPVEPLMPKLVKELESNPIRENLKREKNEDQGDPP